MNASHSQLLAQLLEEPDFVAWAQGHAPKADERWMHWAAGSALQMEVLEKAKAIVQALEKEATSLTDEHIEGRIQEALRRAKSTQQDLETRKNLVFWGIRTLGIAASLIALLGIGWLLYRTSYERKTSRRMAEHSAAAAPFLTISHTGQGVRYVPLPDGSSVVLHHNSSVRFPRRFESTRREVALTGEAFFEITKNPDQPFFVYANEVVAKVHGTSFSVKADVAGENVIIAVKTGKVSVFAKRDANAPKYKQEKELTALVLRCNEQATFERSLSRFVLSKIKMPVLLNIPIEQQVFTYAETPVSDVFAELGRAYGVEIRYDAGTMADCSITATLGDEPLENKIKWICAILEAEYDITPGAILIRGNACK